ncbi:hypothetical protein [Pasteuria penetrans]|uniref:hypothetical protein n=1 Tax=Pasteuria penetrans TaxID=86005 RepID=UPI000FAF7899|nr:hypothetical protein [Pasteuria penetrans]
MKNIGVEKNNMKKYEKLIKDLKALTSLEYKGIDERGGRVLFQYNDAKVTLPFTKDRNVKIISVGTREEAAKICMLEGYQTGQYTLMNIGGSLQLVQYFPGPYGSLGQVVTVSPSTTSVASTVVSSTSTVTVPSTPTPATSTSLGRVVEPKAGGKQPLFVENTPRTTDEKEKGGYGNPGVEGNSKKPTVGGNKLGREHERARRQPESKKGDMVPSTATNIPTAITLSAIAAMTAAAALFFVYYPRKSIIKDKNNG